MIRKQSIPLVTSGSSSDKDFRADEWLQKQMLKNGRTSCSHSSVPVKHFKSQEEDVKKNRASGVKHSSGTGQSKTAENKKIPPTVFIYRK